jgi:hypothetical protein
MQLKGRHWLGLWLLAFLIVAAVVVARQATGRAVALRLRSLRVERLALEAQRADLERRIGVGSSRRVLIPLVARLGLHPPNDSSIVVFAVPVHDPEER